MTKTRLVEKPCCFSLPSFVYPQKINSRCFKEYNLLNKCILGWKRQCFRQKQHIGLKRSFKVVWTYRIACCKEDTHVSREDNLEKSVYELSREELPTEKLSWEEVERITSSLVKKIELQSDSFDSILAVTRGGLIPATLIAEALELRTMFVATVIFYGDKGDPFYGLTEPRILYFPENSFLKDRKILIVDDVWDTGRTCKMVTERCQRAGAACKTAVLHYKPSRSHFPDYLPEYYSVTTEKWIIYPWELQSPITRSLLSV